MIRSFANKETEKVFHGEYSRKLPQDIQQRAQAKLKRIENAESINDLRIPPSNHLEALTGNLKQYHSIRINRSWRIQFIWSDGNPTNVEITNHYGD